MGRFQGRNNSNRGGRGRGGRGFGRRTNTSQTSTSKSSATSSKKKTLADHVYYVGSAKQASDYVTNTIFIINHIKKTYRGGNDVAEALTKMEEFDFNSIKPIRQVSTATVDATKAAENEQFLEEWKIEYQAYNERVNRYRTNKEQAYGLLWDQCSSAMKSKILARKDYENDIENNLIKLLMAIKQHALSYESSQYRWRTIVDAMKAFVNLRQQDDENDVEYLKRFKVARDVFLSHVGKSFSFPRVVEEDKDYQGYQDVLNDKTASDDDKKDANNKIYQIVKTTNEQFLAYLFLENSDKSKYGTLLKNLHEQFNLENPQYPKTLADAQKVINQHPYDQEYKNKKKKQREEHRSKGSRPDSKDSEEKKPPALSFAQMKTKNICYCCGQGHKLPDCPHKETTPKDKWHINKSKEVQHYHQLTQEVTKVMNECASANKDHQAKTQDASSSGAWQFFTFAHAKPSSSEIPMSDKLTLDTGSGHHLLCNDRYVYDIKRAKETLNLTTNGGGMEVNQEGTFPGLGTVPFDEDSITNILAFALLTDKYRITYDNAVEDAFCVHTPGRVTKFPRDKATNLYTYTPHPLARATKQPVLFKSLLQTVAENKKLYTPAEIKKAKQARDLLAILGTPSISDLKKAISMNAIANLTVTTKDVDRAEAIFGPDLGAVKGKTTRKKPMPMVSDQIDLPTELVSRTDLELSMDIMYVNEMPFLTSITHQLQYRTAQFLPTRTFKDLYTALDDILRMYNSNGFVITKIYCDGEFSEFMDPVRDQLDVEMEYAAPQAHVPRAERNNRTIKERIRATFHRLPYNALPRPLMKALVSESARKLNFFPAKHGISSHYSPRQIVHRQTLDANHHCRFALGAYVQAHDEPDPSNTQAPRTLDAIYMRPIQNGHEILNLKTEKVIVRRALTEFPITPTVIAAVEAMADAQKQKGLRIKSKRGITLYDSSWTAGVDYEEDQNETDDESDDEEYQPQSDDEEDDPMNNEDYEEEGEEQEALEVLHEDAQELTGVVQHPGIAEEDAQIDEHPVQDEDEEDDSLEHDSRANELEPEELDHEDPAPVLSEPELRRSSRERTAPAMLSPRMTGQLHGNTFHNHLHTESVEPTEYDEDIAKYAAMLLQHLNEREISREERQEGYNLLVTYSLQKGIKKFGDKGYESAKSEMKQLHDRNCWTPIQISTMTPQEKKKALESLIFLVEKRDGKIKSRHCANGSKQRAWMNPEEAASPTAMTESVMLTATLEAQEGRDVATFDIPNAFIQTPVEERDAQGDRIVMKIRGAMVNMLVELDPSYQEFVTKENNQPILYVHIQRAIYGMLMSGLLYYKKFRASVERIGYKVNPYDPCVANKIIDGKQHTILWHVDDVKSSHMDPKVNDKFHEWLQQEYGQIKEITATRGKIHAYLGMTLDYSDPGKVKVDMRDYVKAMIEEFPKKLAGTTPDPANDQLYKISLGQRLDPLKSEAFHTFVAKALFLTKRARPDIQMAVAFLCTRVKESTTYDWSKLTRVLDFLQGTREDVLTLEHDGSDKVTWSVDAAFAVHPDAKSHTGMTMTLGKGAVNNMSRKQKLVTRSSTEAELVAVDDSLAQIMWTKYFLEEQGYNMRHVLKQDNESAMKLEKNGMKSVGQRSRHINIRYFFITEKISNGELELEYCPTDDMDSDYHTKPLTGAKGKKHRATIMNL